MPNTIEQLPAIDSESADRVLQKYSRLLFRNMENGIIHNPYNQEIREYTAVEQGNVEELKRIQKEDYTKWHGILSTDPVRHEKNLGIVITTLARSAAARGGVSPEACYSLSDATIQEMEECRDIATIRHIYRTTELRYAMMVRDRRNLLSESSQDRFSRSDNPHINHCKDYIFSHLHDKLTVKKIADAIGLEPNYLSALFHRLEGITLKYYIINEKINLARNMLVYSSYSFIEIANYLGFSSQSHLGEQFRRITGSTMQQYRDRYGKDDFLHEVISREAASENGPSQAGDAREES